MKRNRKPKFDGEKRRKRYEEIEREVHNLFGFWMICKERNCHRVRRCAGELQPCFDRHWPIVAEPAKDSFRAMLKASATGASAEELLRVGDEAEARAEAAAAAKTAAR
jgi:hypothetical protein